MNERYARHNQIPGWAPGRLASATVVIVGVGALGTEVARLLAQAGVSRLVLCDGDTVEESNLSRGALFYPEDVGRPKVTAAAATLSQLCPDIVLDPRNAWLVCGVGLAEVRDAALVISCLDSQGARVQLAMRCGLAGAALLDAGTQPWGGEVRFYPADGPCYGCSLTDSERAIRDDGLSCTRDNPESHGASGAVSALVASWLAATALRVVFGLPVRGGTLRVDAASGDTRRLPYARNPACPLHARIPPDLVERSLLTCDATVAELLEQLGPGEAALGWTFIRSKRPFSTWLSDAVPTATLRELGIAPREIIRIIARQDTRADRYIELAAGPAGGDRR